MMVDRAGPVRISGGVEYVRCEGRGDLGAAPSCKVERLRTKPAYAVDLHGRTIRAGTLLVGVVRRIRDRVR